MKRLILSISSGALLLTALPAVATTAGGGLAITNQLRVFFDDWIGPIATMFAVAGLIFGLIQIGLGRGPDAFTNAVRWLVVVGMVVGIIALLAQSGITAATI